MEPAGVGGGGGGVPGGRTRGAASGRDCGGGLGGGGVWRGGVRWFPRRRGFVLVGSRLAGRPRERQVAPGRPFCRAALRDLTLAPRPAYGDSQGLAPPVCPPCGPVFGCGGARKDP